MNWLNLSSTNERPHLNCYDGKRGNLLDASSLKGTTIYLERKKKGRNESEVPERKMKKNGVVQCILVFVLF